MKFHFTQREIGGKCKQKCPWLCDERKVSFDLEARAIGGSIEKLFAVRHVLKLIQIDE
jgi:hypothetical protein